MSSTHTPDRPLRIGLLCHSTNPRGGVVHALELAEALASQGHEPVVHAPDATGQGFFRRTDFETVCIPAKPVSGRLQTLVETRVDDYVRHFATPSNRRFHVFHAQDGISGNALCTLREQGHISGFVRTVHHIDHFDDPTMMNLQRRAIVGASGHAVVSNLWKARLQTDYNLQAISVGNGVNLRRFTPRQCGGEEALKERFGLRPGPIVLSVGGVEQRKNTLRLLDAFAQLRQVHSAAQLIIAGGVSLLDHQAYQSDFQDRLSAYNFPRGTIILTGRLDDADMPALYRSADVLAFPSVTEGFGLVVLEAMACGLPVLTSRIAPFTEYLNEDDVIWCDPTNIISIADGLMLTLQTTLRNRLIRRGAAVAARLSWNKTAEAHMPLYAKMKENAYA